MLADPNADVLLRNYYESLRAFLQSERSTWDSLYSQLARYILPRSPRFNYSDVDQGQRSDGDIVDNTGTLALRTTAAGMMSGITAPSREWFKLKTDNEAINDLPEVQDYCERAANCIRRVFLKGNFYPTLHNYYRELALYGTSVFLILADPQDGIRCYPYPLGSYYLSGNAELRIDFSMRILSMTARQIVDKYGIKNTSSAIRQYYESNAGGIKEQWWPVVHVLHPANYYGAQAVNSGKYQPWVSVVYEMNTFADQTSKLKLLSRGGFEECPFIATRWEVTGENFYGNSPAMDCLGDVMGLQLNERRISEAVDKMVKPPMVADARLANTAMSILPGGITFADTRDGHPGFKPAFDMKFDILAGDGRSDKMRKRIESALYKDLFMMIAASDRREVTAEEIRAKQEEKMTVLGPVLERINDEGLKPIICRTFKLLRRAGIIPPPPQVAKGAMLSFEFESILAQAQRLLKIAGMDRLTTFIAQQSPVLQGIQDNIDPDKLVKDYASALGVPPDIMRSPDDVKAIRAQRAKTQQAAQLADNAQKLAPAAAALSQAPAGAQTALTQMASTLGDQS